jgi:hypothetical protein
LETERFSKEAIFSSLFRCSSRGGFLFHAGNAHHSLKSREIYTVRYDAVKRISFFENFAPQIPEKYLYTTPRK